MVCREFLCPKFCEQLGVRGLALTKVIGDGIDVALREDVVIVSGLATFELACEVLRVLLELVAAGSARI